MTGAAMFDVAAWMRGAINSEIRQNIRTNPDTDLIGRTDNHEERHDRREPDQNVLRQRRHEKFATPPSVRPVMALSVECPMGETL